MPKKDYRIFINDKFEPIITVPFRQKQLELVYDILYEKVGELRDSFTEENKDTNVPMQTELLRVNRKLNYALQELIKFRVQYRDSEPI